MSGLDDIAFRDHVLRSCRRNSGCRSDPHPQAGDHPGSSVARLKRRANFKIRLKISALQARRIK